MNNLEAARPSECVINTLDEMDAFFWDMNVFLEYKDAVIYEEVAIKAVEYFLANIKN